MTLRTYFFTLCQGATLFFFLHMAELWRAGKMDGNPGRWFVPVGLVCIVSIIVQEAIKIARKKKSEKRALKNQTSTL